MPHHCAASGCTNQAASGYSPLCSRHRAIQRRHGYPEQMAVTVAELRQYRRQVAARRKANPESPAWRILEDRWACVLAHARETLKAREAGRACIRYMVEAARHLQAIGESVPPADVVEASLAISMMLASEPHRFKSDRAFNHQLVRRVHGLTTTSSGSYWNHKRQRMQRVYKDLPPRTVRAIAQHLREAFAGAGAQLAGLEQAQKDAAASERKRLEDSLMAMR
jgi:hypothetical protein